jgi:hypothetical protein
MLLERYADTHKIHSLREKYFDAFHSHTRWSSCIHIKTLGSTPLIFYTFVIEKNIEHHSTVTPIGLPTDGSQFATSLIRTQWVRSNYASLYLFLFSFFLS